MTVTPQRGLAWASLSLVFFVAALFAALPLLAAVNLVWDAPHLAEMAIWSPIWGVLSILGVLLAAQLVLGAWLRPPPIAIAIAAVGLGLTEPELVGPTAALFAVLTGLAVAAFGAFLAPRRLIAWPLAAVLLGCLGVAVIVLSNLPGLGDGIAPESWPLAIWVGISGLYATVATGLVIRRALDRSGDELIS